MWKCPCTNYCVLLGVSLQEVSEDGEILSDDDDDFESLDKFPINEIEPDEPIEYDVPQWRPLVSFLFWPLTSQLSPWSSPLLSLPS